MTVSSAVNTAVHNNNNNNNNNNRLSNAQGTKSSPSKATNVKKTGITVKRKPAAAHAPSSNPIGINNNNVKPPSPTAANKKSKKSYGNNIINGKSNPSTSASSTAAAAAAVGSFDLEATICPICDEACTCPKTSTPAVLVKSPVKKVTKKSPAPVTKTLSKNKKETPKYLNSKKKLHSYELTESSEGDFEEVEEREDPALSFIRMIYSDEESLDEEEAYALYQATQLFSSSDDEDDEAFTSKKIYDIGDDSEGDEYTTDDSDTGSESDGFEYTVVEYVQPLKKSSKKTFVAYDSDEEDGPSEEDEAVALSTSLQDQLLLNATASDHDEEMDDDDDDSCDDSGGNDENGMSSETESEGNWLTYSVFDVDSDLPNLTGGNSGTCLSSHGSGTPDTLLFSTSSTDKIPNIAPQVLAAISAAAKHMAANNQTGGSQASSKYFSYITLRETAREQVDGEEFLFFEESRSVSGSDDDQEESDSDLEIEDSDCISSCDSINSLDSLSDGGVVELVEDIEDSFSDESSVNKKKRSRAVAAAAAAAVAVTTMPVSTDFMTSLNRWSRVPIGAFRRSRRPSIPSFHHSVHPSTALKTFSTDPASLTLTPAPNHHNNEDSFDEASCNMGIEGPERSYSVITWDELDLDLDIVPNTTSTNTGTGSSPSNMQTTWPLPKRSRSVVAATPTNLANNFEWLNNSNWNWEI